MKKLTISLVIFFQFIKNQTVCSLRELREELKEDLKDNNRLNCQKIQIPPEQGKEHDKEDIKRRQEGVWNSDCAFQAEVNIWKQQLSEIYGITAVYDNAGDVENPDNYQFQAHLCMIIRTIIFESKKGSILPPVISTIDIDKISCPGNTDLNRICAVTYGNFAEKDNWHIFLAGGGISINNNPYWKPHIIQANQPSMQGLENADHPAIIDPTGMKQNEMIV